VKNNDNLTIERPTFVTHLECAMEGDHYPADQIHNLSKAGKPLLVRYDLPGVRKALTKDALKLQICGAIGRCCRCARSPISSASAR
jgi:threonine synthase